MYLPQISPPSSTYTPYWNPQIPTLTTLYCLAHLLPVLILYEEASLGSHSQAYSQWTLLGCTATVALSLTSLGMLFEGRPWAWKTELLRVSTFLLLQTVIAIDCNPLETLEYGSFRHLAPELRLFIPHLIRFGFITSIVFSLYELFWRTLNKKEKNF